VRRAGELADRALLRARELAGPGVFEGEILAAMQSEVLRAGGDYSGNEFTIGSGEGALLPRYHSGRRRLDDEDQLVVQIGGVYRRYHASLMSTILIGGVKPQQQRMYGAMSEALNKAHDLMRPGIPLCEVYAAYRDCAARRDLEPHMLSACGYSLGAAYHPTWMDWPWVHPDCGVELAPNMVFYLHMVLSDQERGLAMSLADTVVVRDGACERLSKLPLELVVK
jgi:Xaa-Pro dipeptidase